MANRSALTIELARVRAAAGVLAGHMQTLAEHPLSERNPDGVEQAAESMRLIAREALEQWRAASGTEEHE